MKRMLKEETMKENKGNAKKIIIGVVILAVLVALFAVIWNQNKPVSTQGAKAFTVEVTGESGETKSYTGRTDAEFLRGLMDELAEKGDFSYEGSEGDYGLMITTINGEEAIYENDGSYWAIYVNGEYGNFGADQQPVEDGGVYGFVHEKG